MDYLSLCAIVKDENEYLPEWLEYHKLLGVDRFYIYDNGSAVPVRKTLERDVASGRVIVFDFPGHAKQVEAYLNCSRRLEGKSEWVGFIDVDEFIVLKRGEDLRQFMPQFYGYGGLAINWQTFGPSGHKTKPEGLQIENFLMKGPIDFDWNQHVKTIARPVCVYMFLNCHYANYHPGYMSVNERGAAVPGPFSLPVSVDAIQVNHYFTRSYEEFCKKSARGAADGTSKRMEFYDIIEKGCSSVKDDYLLKYADRVKAALRERENGA